MPPYPPTKAAAEARYNGLRLAALSRAAALFAPTIAPVPVRLGTITAVALDTCAMQWTGHPARVVAWSWGVMVLNHRRRHPSRFELALWSGGTLCGLALGRAGNTHCSMEYLEGSPAIGHPLKGQVIPAALTALAAYAAVLGKAEMRLVEPFEPLLPLYKARGFLLVEPKGESRYCVRKTP